MKIHDEAATRDALPFPALIAALERLFAEGCEVPPRQVHPIRNPDGRDGTLLIMPAWQSGRFIGIKTVAVYPANAAQGLPGLHASYLLLDAHTGVPLAMMDGNQITARRTVAASALAASRLARPDAKRLLVIGGGRVAALLPAAYRAVLPIESVQVWTRQRAQAEALAATWRLDGLAAQPVHDLAAAAARADIVSCATMASAPIVQGAWLQPGSHLDLIGGFAPGMREADDACLVGAAIYVDTDEALKKSGDLLDPIAHGVISAADIHGDLAGLCRGTVSGRETLTQRTVFKSVGNALEDLAAAMLVHEGGGGASRHEAPDRRDGCAS